MSGRGGARAGAGRKSVNGGSGKEGGPRTPASIKLPPHLWEALEAQAQALGVSRNALIEKVLLGAIYGDENPNLQTPLDLGTQEYADPAGAARSLVLKGAAHMDSKTADIMRAEDYPRGPILAKGYGSFGNYLLKAGYILVNKEGRFSLNPAKRF